jgi:purine-cytosine permease-like protein
MASIMGFTMISTVVGGQTLVALSNDTLSVQSGIVIIALISMFLSIAGYKIMHAYLRYAWIPALIAIVICVGVGGKYLKEHAPAEAPEASTVISFASIIAGYMIPFVSTCGNYTVYMPLTTPK